MLVSIILPVYNVEKYLGQCLDALRILAYADFEIIAINDGSTDNSGKILTSYQLLMPNLKIITQPNGGLSKARNIGLQHATGKYVVFIDSDDYIDAHALEQLLIHAENIAAEIVVGDYVRIDNSGTIISNRKDESLPAYQVFNGITFYTSFYLSITSVVWRSLYLLDFLRQNNLYFHEGVLFEDVEFTPIAFANAQKVSYAPMSFYFYRERDNSIMTSKGSLKKVQDAIKVWEVLTQQAKNYDNKELSAIMQECGFHSFLLQYALLVDTAALQTNLDVAVRLLHHAQLKRTKYKLLKLLFLKMPKNFFHQLLRISLCKPLK